MDTHHTLTNEEIALKNKFLQPDVLTLAEGAAVPLHGRLSLGSVIIHYVSIQWCVWYWKNLLTFILKIQYLNDAFDLSIQIFACSRELVLHNCFLTRYKNDEVIFSKDQIYWCLTNYCTIICRLETWQKVWSREGSFNSPWMVAPPC